MKNSHIGCIIVFILVAVGFIVFSVPRIKEMDSQRTIEQKRRDSAALERAWAIADSVKREQLMEDPDYVELLEIIEEQKEEIEYLEDSIRHLNEQGY